MEKHAYKAIVGVQKELAREFKPVAGFVGYSVSGCGDVFSAISGKILKHRMVGGYPMVTLCGEYKKPIHIHVLVLSSFVGKRPDGYVANHINGIKTDNRVENLEWTTQSENVSHAYKKGLRKINKAHRERCALLGKNKRSYTQEQCDEIQKKYTGARGEINSLAKKHGISRDAVSNILRGTR
jgi:hypothetical protein